MASNTNKDYTQMHIKASDHPKAYAPHILILNMWCIRFWMIRCFNMHLIIQKRMHHIFLF